jgi:hypothetical protein
MAELFRMASIAEDESSISQTRNVRESHSSPLARDEVTFDDFSAAMLFGANFRNVSKSVVISSANFIESSETAGPALQRSLTSQMQQISAFSRSAPPSPHVHL